MTQPIFTDLAEAIAFNHRLALVAVATDRELGALSYASCILASLIGDHRPEGSEDGIKCSAGCGVYPCRTILTITGNVGFPIDWSITQTVAAIDRTKMALWLEPGNNSEFAIGGDPREQYTRQEDGDWRYSKIERGTERKSAIIPASEISAHFLHFVAAEYWNYKYPFAWLIKDEDWNTAAPIAREKAEGWRHELTRPYMVNTARELSQD